MSRKKNIFISHVHEDDSEVTKFKKLLTSQGYEIRDSSIVKSKPNNAKNEDYIKSDILAPRITWAGTLVVLISPETHKSKWVDWEIEYAHKNDTRIVGVWCQGAKEADLPSNLDLYADAVVGWQGATVIDAINGKTNKWYNSNNIEQNDRNIVRYTCP